MESDVFNPSHELRAAVLSCLSAFLASVSLFFALFNAYFNQSYLLSGLEFAYFLVSVYVYWRARQGKVRIAVSVAYIYFLVLIVAVGTYISVFSSALVVWTCLFPVINYLLLGRRYGLLSTGCVLLIQTLVISLKIHQVNHVIDYRMLMNLSGVYLSLWILSHIYEVRRKFSEQSLERMAARDALTGIFNRHALLHHFENQRKVLSNTSLSVLILDLDYFKKVNDQYGHNTGDKVLIQAANLLRDLLPNHNAYRIGGEEFCITLNNVDVDKAVHIAEYLRKKFANHIFHVSGYSIQLTASIGVCECAAELTLEDVLIAADVELYRAKQNGRNQVMVCGSYENEPEQEALSTA